eukprot:scaffold30710_cov61-Phaeocystis_antarctica.AAC.1
MQIAWSKRTLQEENSLGRVSRSRPDLVISQAVVPLTKCRSTSGGAIPKTHCRSPAQPPNLSGTGSGR